NLRKVAPNDDREARKGARRASKQFSSTNRFFATYRRRGTSLPQSASQVRESSVSGCVSLARRGGVLSVSSCRGSWELRRLREGRARQFTRRQALLAV